MNYYSASHALLFGLVALSPATQAAVNPNLPLLMKQAGVGIDNGFATSVCLKGEAKLTKIKPSEQKTLYTKTLSNKDVERAKSGYLENPTTNHATIVNQGNEHTLTINYLAVYRGGTISFNPTVENSHYVYDERLNKFVDYAKQYQGDPEAMSMLSARFESLCGQGYSKEQQFGGLIQLKFTYKFENEVELNEFYTALKASKENINSEGDFIEHLAAKAGLTIPELASSNVSAQGLYANDAVGTEYFEKIKADIYWISADNQAVRNSFVSFANNYFFTEVTLSDLSQYNQAMIGYQLSSEHYNLKDAMGL